ncbi:hypothetical protein PMAYCL1PPCAC_03339, partial [Pristionchus mayeri]
LEEMENELMDLPPSLDDLPSITELTEQLEMGAPVDRAVRLSAVEQWNDARPTLSRASISSDVLASSDRTPDGETPERSAPLTSDSSVTLCFSGLSLVDNSQQEGDSREQQQPLSRAQQLLQQKLQNRLEQQAEWSKTDLPVPEALPMPSAMDYYWFMNLPDHELPARRPSETT